MRFIRMATHTEEFYRSPPPNFGELLAAHKGWLAEQKKSGRLIDAYLLAGNAQGDRNVFVWEFGSTDEIDKAVWEDPIGFTFKWEVYPAVDIFEHIDNVLPAFGHKG
ncbi:MAG: hypothetical protein LBS32_08860 [Clostridiales Family XIII bacterium]|jgi:hypothetical protein|nr:hypothetical protein [Clostridiales Family XIII bacterium]